MLFLQMLFFRLQALPAASFPKPLSPEEERECLTRAAAGDTAAREKLIRHNLRLVAHIIKKYYYTAADQDDLISIGTIGLIKAIGSYQPEKGTKLATYTARCIENEILMHFRSRRRMASEVSLEEPMEFDSEGNALALEDVLHTEDDLAEQLGAREDARRLYRALETLEPREREIVALRYGLYRVPKALPQREVAEKCGISRSYVSRLEKKALGKLRAALEGGGGGGGV